MQLNRNCWPQKKKNLKLELCWESEVLQSGHFFDSITIDYQVELRIWDSWEVLMTAIWPITILGILWVVEESFATPDGLINNQTLWRYETDSDVDAEDLKLIG